MTTVPPGVHPDKQRRSGLGKKSRSVRSVRGIEDRTRYPDWEPVGRGLTESAIVRDFEPQLVRYMADRGIVCLVGSDNFIYYVKGNNKACVSPDVYTLLGLQPRALPTDTVGSNNESCWKTWLHEVVPNFALEVKALRNPRKDELQSPERHEALGTKELIVFDPFAERRQAPRKRFCVYRRDAAGAWRVVIDTNDDRVYSEELQAYLVAERVNGVASLRLALGPNGEQLLPFEHELADLEKRRADEEARMRQEESRRADEVARRADEEANKRQEESRRADEEANKRQEESRRADDAARRVAELEAELARLKASMR
jgi:hypothetical protein